LAERPFSLAGNVTDRVYFKHLQFLAVRI